MNLDSIVDLYHDIAPAAFATFGKKPVPLSVGLHIWTKPGDESFLEVLTASPTLSLAVTFYRFDTDETGITGCAPGANSSFICFNPYWGEVMDEDEVEVVLLHEIAHAVGTHGDSHGPNWVERGRMLHPKAGDALFTIRATDMAPYEFARDTFNSPTLG